MANPLPGTPGFTSGGFNIDRSDRRDLERRLDEQERLEREADKTRVRVYQFGSRVTKYDGAYWAVQPLGTLLTIFDGPTLQAKRIACYTTWDSVEGPCFDNPSTERKTPDEMIREMRDMRYGPA